IARMLSGRIAILFSRLAKPYASWNTTFPSRATNATPEKPWSASHFSRASSLSQASLGGGSCPRLGVHSKEVTTALRSHIALPALAKTIANRGKRDVPCRIHFHIGFGPMIIGLRNSLMKNGLTYIIRCQGTGLARHEGV